MIAYGSFFEIWLYSNYIQGCNLYRYVNIHIKTCSFITILGDQAQALHKILLLVESKSKLLEEFIFEGLRFSSSMYLCLRIFRYILRNPEDVKKKLNPTLLSFADFFQPPTRDNYIEGLMSSMSKLTIKPNKPYPAKTKLYELADSDDNDTNMAYVPLPHSSNDEDEMPVSPKKKEKSKT